MPLIVPILRLGVLGLNVYDTFKVLKKPPPSQRSLDGRPSVRAQTQRKRDMKGCLAVWIVWCCYAIYERTLDSIVSMFVPFYNEFKGIILLFLLLSRARGAEPIYLHVIRPLIKPYTSTIDPLLDVAFMFGDLVFLVGTYPLRAAADSRVTKTVRGWWAQEEVPQHAPETLATPRKPRGPPPARPSSSSRRASDSSNQVASGSSPVIRRHASDGLPTSPVNALQSAFARNLPPGFVPQSEIWYPSASAYAQEGIPAPIQYEPVEEWRLYPAFPSAYPPTPIAVKTASLSHEVVEPHIEEEEEEEEELPSGPWNLDHEGDADRTIQPPSHDSSDEAQDSDQDFDITLQTPHMRTRSIRSPSSIATGLTTVDNGSSLRTPSRSPPPRRRQRATRQRATSSTSDSMSLSDAASISIGSSDASEVEAFPGPSGRKRIHSGSITGDVRSRADAFDRARAASANRGRGAGRLPVPTRSNSSRATKESYASASETDESADEPPQGTKRRRAVAAPQPPRSSTRVPASSAGRVNRSAR